MTSGVTERHSIEFTDLQVRCNKEEITLTLELNCTYCMHSAMQYSHQR